MMIVIFGILFACAIAIWMNKAKLSMYLFALSFICAVVVFLRYLPLKVPL
jgi:hypothetical protein